MAGERVMEAEENVGWMMTAKEENRKILAEPMSLGKRKKLDTGRTGNLGKISKIVLMLCFLNLILVPPPLSARP